MADANDTPPTIRVGEDTTKSALSKSKLSKKYLCDYVINTAVGCRHGCRFCYVPSTPAVRTRGEMLKEEADVDNPQSEWGEYVLRAKEREVESSPAQESLADELEHYIACYPRVERLVKTLQNKRTWDDTSGGQGIVALSSATDCYQDAETATVTRACLIALALHERPDGEPIHVRVLTRNPILALQDMDVFQELGDRVVVGSSIPCLDDAQVRAIEPRAPAPKARLDGLQEFADAGVPVFVSMSPTYPTMDYDDLYEQLERFSALDPAVVFHEPINPRGGNFSMTVDGARESGAEHLATELERIRTSPAWEEYAVRHLRWVQEAAEAVGVPIHLWPDESLLKRTEGETTDWLEAWLARQSPEAFAGRNPPTGAPPTLPTTTTDAQLSDFGGGAE